MFHRTPIRIIGRAAGLLLLLACLNLPGLTARVQAQDEADLIRLQVDAFGVGNVYRPGTITPVRVTVFYAGTAPVNAFVAIDLPDSDGDVEVLGRRITLNPGFPNSLWIYLPISYQFDLSKPLEFRIFEMNDEELGREISVARQTISRAGVDPEVNVMGIIGNGHGNLRTYAQGQEARFRNRKPTFSHESTAVLSGLRVSDLPDRWYGYDMFETLAWFEGSGAEPTAVRADVGRAVSDWVHRGGHLIIALPEASDFWIGTQLDRVIPRVQWELIEGVPLTDGDAGTRDLLELMSRAKALDASIPVPRFSIHRFYPAGETWEESGAIPFLEIDHRLEDGTVERWPVVVQQNFGHGRVTMLGIPVTDRRLALSGLALPEAEILWNQILGRRQDTPGPGEIAQVGQQNQLILDNPDTPSISAEISKSVELTARAVSGLLLALVLFAAYWVVSGPAAFAFLKHRGWAHQNWLIFVLVAGAFTLVSWVGARSLRSKEIKPRHLTVLDHVAGYEFDRATTIFTSVLPGYGRQEIRIGAEDGDANSPGEFDLLHAFLDPSSRGSADFPDQRRYRVDAGRQTVIDMPARHTAKTLTARWLGPTQPGWGMPIPDGSTEWPSIDGQGQLRGTLSHTLPARMRDVLIVYVSNEYNGRRVRSTGTNGGASRLDAYGWEMGQPWEPGEAINLSDPQFDYAASSGFFTTNGTLDSYVRRARGGSNTYGYGTTNLNLSTERRIQLLSFYHQLRPPAWQSANGNASGPHMRLTRSLGRELDLSPWLNRPCLIIIGFIDGSPVPSPIEVGGERLTDADAESLTIVRWILPLAVEEAPRE